MSILWQCPDCKTVYDVPFHRDMAHARCPMCRSHYTLTCRKENGPANNLKLEGSRYVPVSKAG